ncbi:LOW QUALITY PROTEIN: glucosylceramide transporter ABCA12-like [Lethenteron reissneri]|uniref:LOW QUALITY PROTEIN: glucosylceramide transporter ABCA12-like n=1 Tax=Lethenteron reissneri TaxID=7753 RepID=UPI002AB6E9B1|nr:LOW QUALITY PROTEIN: glucosylceramide transporter ABCA12-like [Lethenteron reissneri]
MVITLLEHINIRNVIYKMLTPQILKDFENLLLIVVDRLLMIMQKVEPFMTTLPQLLDAVRQLNISDIMQSSQSPGARQARSTNTQSLSKLSKTFCAGTTQRMLADVRMANLPTPLPSSSLSPEDFKAKYNIPYGTSPYCLDVYTDIIHGKNGEVIWRFLKPLMLGKILYTPRSAATELLIRTANSTFQKMGELSSYAQEWLHAMGNQNANLQIQQLGILKNALANPFVQGFIRSQMNINMTSFMQNLKSFEELGVQLTDTTMDNLKTLSTLMVNISSCVELNRFVPSDSVEELNKRAIGLNKENNLMASVIFHLPEAQNRSRRAVSNLPLATHLNYTLRLSIQNVMRTDYLRDLVWVPGPHTNQNYMYYTHAFLPIQDMLERAAISLYIGRDVSEPALQVQPMPYPCYTDDSFLHSVGLMFPILFMIAWILTIASTVKFLVQEKELCQQEYMNIMGVRPASHFLSWLLQSCALLLLMVILLTVILKASGTLPSTNWALLLALFLCFGISVLAMGYMLSACFTHTNVASLTACFIYLLSFFPFLALSSLTLTLTRWQKSLICLLSPTAFSYASQLMGHFEDQGIGAQWSNMYQSPLYGDDISFAYLCWMLIIDTAIYFIVGWYIRNVYPGTYGLARPFYFLFTVSYWQQVCCCGSRRRPMGYLARNMAHESPADSKTDAKDGSMRPQLEAVPAGLTAGVSLRSLTKQYSKGKKAALQDLSLDFYEDQITTLLGHNGAGKTTTMSLLMGLYEPSSGSVHVGGRDARTDMAEVRRQLGVCLQRDVLFPALNVHEHLFLYGRLKALGWSRQRLQQEVDTFLNDLGLYNHKDKLVGTLSGGMKRKLSIAIAFIGGSTTVILDEPTSGVDPCSRRSIWNLILKHRAGRTIILSTHHLDEAEVLSDRIAVLEHGKLRCCGSPQYLKEIYGQGLTLTLTKKSAALGSRSPFDPERVVSLVRSGVEGAVLKSGEDSSGNRNADMVFLLPAHSQNVLGQSFLATLEENMEELGLSGYAISDTTLEEVFLKLVQEAEDQSLKDITNKFPEAESGSINSETAAPPDHTSPAASDTSDTVSLESEGSSQDSFEKHLVKKERVTGIHLLVHKTQALIYKRFHHWRRDVKGAAAQIVLPVILVALAMAFASMEPGVPEYPSLHLQPSLYSSASFFSLHNSSSASASSLTSTLMKHAACLDQPPSRNNSCWANRPPTSWLPSAKGDESSCSCTSCKELCSAVQDMPSYTNVNPQLQMFNLSGYDVEEYLMGTTCQYLLKRYGGWSFGLPHTASSDLEVVPDNRTLTKVWYNPEGYHALPAYVNSLNNLLLWDNLPEGEHPGDYRISVNSKPYAGQQLGQDMILQNLGDTGVAICILLGFSIITGSFATAVVRERITGSKRLQQISGVSPTYYWAVNFAYDMLSYSVTTGLCIAVIAAFNLPAYTDNSNLGAVSLLLILFGFASLPWMYLLSGIFSEEEMAFVTYISINIILGVTTIISTFLVNFLYMSSDSESLYNAYNVMRWLFLVFPQFCLGWGLVSLSKQRLMEDIMTLLGSDPQESSSFAMDITGWPFVALAVNGIVCFTLRLVLTDELIWKLRRWWQRKAVEPGQPELDTDVQAERSRVEEQSRVEDAATPDDALQLVGLRKRYRLLNRSFTAVDGLHLGVSPNQCFGLLGVNGAGKTTTFKMLTGDIQPSGGDAIIRTQNGALLRMDKARRTGTLIGYCPQFDALDDLLTGWEHLYCYARIRGIPSHHIEQVSQELVTRLHLSLHADKLVKTYSGGTKRKLSTALALIGKPQLLLLDEPSSGMDPKSKRYLWKTITREVRQGCSVVLTSHSMEECEALCDKLAIMVNGQFKCLGTLQHLKNRFGNGHMIKLRLSSGNSKVTEVTEFITSHFPGAYLKEQHISQLEFQVPSNAAKLSEIFIALEKEKESLSIQHYSISQTTLDQVFINFARQQIDMEEESSNADARPPVPTV